MPHNVLHLIDTGGPGGAETIFLELVTRLPSDAWRSVAVVPIEDWLSGALRSRGVDPLIIPSTRAFDLPYVAALRRAARDHDIDIIHAHLLSTSVYGSLVGMTLGLPVVCTFHGQADISTSERLRGVKFGIIDRRANDVTFVSAALQRDFLSKVKLRRAKMHVVHNGIDTAAFLQRETGSSFREELGIGADEFLIGAVGNVRPSKGYEVLIRAMGILRSRGVACRCVVVGQKAGSGDLYRGLESLQRDLSLEQMIQFAGFREDVAHAMSSFDVYVSSSHVEGFSLTIVQAMSMSLPVIATRSGGPEEIVTDGVTGLLVDPGSPEQLADAIVAMKNDTVRRHAMSAAGHDSVQDRFGVEDMVNAYARIYKAGLARAGRIRSRP